MPSPQIIARKAGRRGKKSSKPERREKLPVDTADVDMDSVTPSQQSAKAGPGTGGGRERARRVSERIPRAGGAEAHEKPHASGMLDKGVGKRLAKEMKQRASGRASAGELEKRALPTKQPRRQGAKKQSQAAKVKRAVAKKTQRVKSAAPAEAAATQKQVLRDEPRRRRTLRDQGVEETN